MSKQVGCALALVADSAPASQSSALTQLLRCSSKEARSRLPLRYATQYVCLPIGVHQHSDYEYLSVLMASSPSEQQLRTLQFICDCPLEVSSCDSHVLNNAIAVLYARDDSERQRNAKENLGLENKASVATLCRSMIMEAVTLRSSDIHIEHRQDSASVRFRINGELQIQEEFLVSVKECQQLCRQIKVIAQLDSCTPQLAQDGVFDYQQCGLQLRMRVSVVPTAYGEKIVLRLLQNGFLEEIANCDLENQFTHLGLYLDQREIIYRYLRASRGALLISGPTGSGKSTLLYVLLRYLSRTNTNVVSIEDPVEAHIPNACQIDVSRNGYSFDEMLAKVLRQDPDTLLVGEIRTRNTAQTALQAAITGTKVLSSVHAGSCFEVIARLIELGVSGELIALAVHTVSAQRLLARVCQNCCVFEPPSLDMQ